jgi:hypothetical protein
VGAVSMALSPNRFKLVTTQGYNRFGIKRIKYRFKLVTTQGYNRFGIKRIKKQV